MPRSVRLSWQPGAEGSARAGRWRKKYKGKVYYFAGGRGKSDRDAYDAAIDAWEKLKVKIDATTPRRHQGEYERCIDQWEQVLAWSNRYGDRQYTDQAVERLTALRRRFAAAKLSPLKRDDWFEANFESNIPEWVKLPTLTEFYALAPPDATKQPATSSSSARMAVALGLELPAEPVVITPTQEQTDRLDGSPLRIARELWRDRLAVMKRKAAPGDESLQTHVQKFLSQKENQAKAGEVSNGRYYALKLHLTHFQDWLGKDTDVKEIDAEVLINYHMNLLEKTTSKSWGKTTANHYLTTVKAFVRWLWQTNAISTLPRVLDGKSQALKITKPRPGIVTFTKEEIKALLAKASDRTKLYVLLMLNCGMTQKDISDLLVSEVDWKEGRVIRKRSKTGDCENVPTVNYKLWPETFRLLNQERDAKSKERVVSNTNGSPVWSEEITKEGKYQKNDNVKSAFDRLRKVVKIEKPLKSLKKTSASLLRNSGQFSGVEGLFLGHAPQSMSDKHYTQVPQELFDRAVHWLAEEYGLG